MARSTGPSTTVQTTLRLLSSAFAANGEIPAKYTCEGLDVSPPLAWEGVPPGTRSLALIVDDPDAPDPQAPKMTWVHWLLYDLAPGLGRIEEGARPPRGAHVGMNDWKEAKYGGPCPPVGRHRYFFKLYALDTELGDLGAPDKKELLKAMEGHILGHVELVATYERTKKS